MYTALDGDDSEAEQLAHTIIQAEQEREQARKFQVCREALACLEDKIKHQAFKCESPVASFYYVDHDFYIDQQTCRHFEQMWQSHRWKERGFCAAVNYLSTSDGVNVRMWVTFGFLCPSMITPLDGDDSEAAQLAHTIIQAEQEREQTKEFQVCRGALAYLEDKIKHQAVKLDSPRYQGSFYVAEHDFYTDQQTRPHFEQMWQSHRWEERGFTAAVHYVSTSDRVNVRMCVAFGTSRVPVEVVENVLHPHKTCGPYGVEIFLAAMLVLWTPVLVWLLSLPKQTIALVCVVPAILLGSFCAGYVIFKMTNGA